MLLWFRHIRPSEKPARAQDVPAIESDVGTWRNNPACRCIATLSYVYDHATRESPKRLSNDYHAHHDLAQAVAIFAPPDGRQKPSNKRASFQG
jgi:NikR C terminal nickel binding domain